jgi:hypothetical protein
MRTIMVLSIALLVLACTPQNGSEGPVGTQGAQGPAGPKGDRGEQGLTGAAGPKGDRGEQGLTGAVGPQGDRGEQGLTGAQGIQGLTGAQGVPGFTGAQGIQGVAGAQGIQGVAGTAGKDGAVGAQGKQGIQGVAGPQGVQGVAGPVGADGLLLSGTRIKANMFVTPDGAQQFVSWHDTMTGEDCVFLSTTNGVRCVPPPFKVYFPDSSCTDGTQFTEDQGCGAPSHVTHLVTVSSYTCKSTTYRVDTVGSHVSPSGYWVYDQAGCHAAGAFTGNGQFYSLNNDITSNYASATSVLK